MTSDWYDVPKHPRRLWLERTLIALVVLAGLAGLLIAEVGVDAAAAFALVGAVVLAGLAVIVLVGFLLLAGATMLWDGATPLPKWVGRPIAVIMWALVFVAAAVLTTSDYEPPMP